MSGWRSRQANKKNQQPTGNIESGIVVRVSKTGFGFVGATQTSRQRYHFSFQDVVQGDANTLQVGDNITYSTRMNDSTMEKEAFNLKITTRSRSKQSSRISSARSNTKSHNSQTKTNLNLNRTQQTNNTQQQTKDQTDQFGNKRVIDSGALLDIIDGEEGNVIVAKCCDDYDVNPDGGIGFSIDYQRSRGIVISLDEEKRRTQEKRTQKQQEMQAVQLLEEQERASRPKFTNSKSNGGWRSRRAAGNGGGRSLSDM